MIMTKLSKGVNKMELKNGDVSLSVGHVLAHVSEAPSAGGWGGAGGFSSSSLQH